ncbi:MAG: hypothetical protein ACE5DX_03290 [Candidatus Dojkabacteria bacterium]
MMAVADSITTAEELNTAPIDDFEPGDLEEIPEPAPVRDLNVISVKREDTRGRLAIFFLIGFFIILALSIGLVAISEGDKVTGVKEVMLTISGILSGPMGFVIGYYFRSKEPD